MAKTYRGLKLDTTFQKVDLFSIYLFGWVVIVGMSDLISIYGRNYGLGSLDLINARRLMNFSAFEKVIWFIYWDLFKNLFCVMRR